MSLTAVKQAHDALLTGQDFSICASTHLHACTYACVYVRLLLLSRFSEGKRDLNPAHYSKFGWSLFTFDLSLVDELGCTAMLIAMISQSKAERGKMAWHFLVVKKPILAALCVPLFFFLFTLVPIQLFLPSICPLASR